MFFDFLFGTIICWWILFLLGLSGIAMARGGYRMWLRKRRMMAATLAQAADPRNAAARFEIARIQAERSRWKAALARIDEAIAIAAEDSRYNGVPHRFLRLRADCLYGVRDWKGAAAAYRKSLDVPSDAGYGDALIGVARSELRAGRWKEAVEFSRHTIHEKESGLEAYFRWAQAASLMGDGKQVDAAFAGFRRVAALLPPFARQRRLWWRTAFFFFPIARRIG